MLSPSISPMPNSTCQRLLVVAPNDLKYQFLWTGTQNAMWLVQYFCVQSESSA